MGGIVFWNVLRLMRVVAMGRERIRLRRGVLVLERSRSCIRRRVLIASSILSLNSVRVRRSEGDHSGRGNVARCSRVSRVLRIATGVDHSRLCRRGGRRGT